MARRSYAESAIDEFHHDIGLGQCLRITGSPDQPSRRGRLVDGEMRIDRRRDAESFRAAETRATRDRRDCRDPTTTLRSPSPTRRHRRPGRVAPRRRPPPRAAGSRRNNRTAARHGLENGQTEAFVDRMRSQRSRPGGTAGRSPRRRRDPSTTTPGRSSSRAAFFGNQPDAPAITSCRSGCMCTHTFERGDECGVILARFDRSDREQERRTHSRWANCSHV